MAKRTHETDPKASPSGDGPAIEASSPRTTAALSRRSFLGTGLGVAGAAAVPGLPALAGLDRARAFDFGPLADVPRANRAFQTRVAVAAAEGAVGTPPHPSNTDELIYPNKIG